MLNINEMAKDINAETYEQGKKLERLDQHVRTAADNVEKANEHLNQANESQKRSGKCLWWLILIAIVAIALILYFTVFKGNA